MQAGSANVMSIKIREMLEAEARAFLEVHRAAVHKIAVKDYPAEIIEDWAPLITGESVESFLSNPDGEIRLVAIVDGQIAGIGALVLTNRELRACYVAPAAVRQGVGSAIVREIERIARDNGLDYLQMDSSVTAEPFYVAQDFHVTHRGEHALRSGRRMACVKMEKALKRLG
jgi:putative acetyltransferase